MLEKKESKNSSIKKMFRRSLPKKTLPEKEKKVSIKKMAKSKGIYIVLSFVIIFFLIGLSLVRFIHTNDFSSCIVELILLVFVTFFLTVLFLTNGKTRLPKTLLGIKLERRAPKKKRTFAYAIESFFISLSITTIFFVLVATDKIFIDFYGIFHGSLIISVIFVELISFFIFFCLFFLVDYFYGENKFRKEKIPLEEIKS